MAASTLMAMDALVLTAVSGDTIGMVGKSLVSVRLRLSLATAVTVP